MSREIPPGVTPLREQHEAVTRRAILRAARELFAERGYAGTPIRLLAQHAGMAVQTVYATFGSKAGVLRGMPDLIDEEAGVYDLIQELERTNEPRKLLGLYARIRRQIRERCPDMIQILRSGAAVDADVAATLAEGMRRRRFGLARLTARLAASSSLREGLSAERAADVASAIVSDEVCDILVDQGKWSLDDYESWVTNTLATLLLRGSATAPS